MQVPTTGDQRRHAAKKVGNPIRFLTDERLDIPGPVPLRKSYIVASSHRSGSEFFCKSLWQTGVLGAPWEYLNSSFNDARGTFSRPVKQSIQYTMVKRLGASSSLDYMAKLLACRTTSNGVFGMKAYFEDFAAAIRECPALLDVLAPVTYIYFDRRNKLTQAASMAITLQRNTSKAKADSNKPRLRYDRDLISKCLGRLERQRLGWWRWFEANRIEPFVVTHEDVADNAAEVVRRIVALLGVENDKPDRIRLPAFAEQYERINDAWAARFARELQSGVDRHEPEDTDDHAERYFDRYLASVRTIPSDASAITGAERAARLQHRHDAIVVRNREHFQDARVLDVVSGDGAWILAALDAGAAHVVGVEPLPMRVTKARSTLLKFGVRPAAYEVVNSEIFPALEKFKPNTFDLILCTNAVEHFDPRHLFRQLHRLRPKHVILDTDIVAGTGPIVRFKLRLHDASAPKATGRYASILSTPNHELITFLCDYFGFRWRLIDWQKMGVNDWTGVRDYESDRRRTYVLDRIS